MKRAVNEPGGVGGVERRGEVPQPRHEIFDGRRAEIAQRGLQRVAFDEGRNEIGLALI